MAKPKFHVMLTLLCSLTFLLPFLVESVSGSSLNNVVTRVKESKRCSLNICFGLEGSDVLKQVNFNGQKQIVYDLVKKLTKISHLQLSAVQYGITNTAISPLTYSVKEFLENFSQASFVGSSKTAVGSPIVYCDALLSEESGPRIIILLGRGKNTVGGDAVIRANLFRETGGKMVAIAIGDADEKLLTKIVGGDPSRFITYKGDKNSVTNQVLPLLCPEV